MADLDMAKLRELAKEFGYWPATTNPEDIERHRRCNIGADKTLTPEQEAKKWEHDRIRAERTANEERQRAEMADIYDG